MLAIRRGLAVAPKRMRHKIFHDLRAPYGLTGINAGDTEAVHERTIANVHRQQLVEVQGQTDVLVMGVPYLGPYNVNSTMNPILATCMGLGYFFNSYRNQPLVRRGGAVILYHPLEPDFNQLHHPSYVDFYEEILAESTDPAVIEEKYEQQFATDPWYIHLYRTSHAYHGVHPFYMWYWAAHAMDHVDDVIWVGGNRKSRSAAGVPGRVDAGGRARAGVRDGRQQPVDHLPAQPAARDRGRALMGFLKDGVDDVRTVAQGLAVGTPPAGAAVGRGVRAAVEDHGVPDRLVATPPGPLRPRRRPEGCPRAADAHAGAPPRRGARRALADRRAGHLRGQPRLPPRHAADPAVAARRVAPARPRSRPRPTTSSTPGGGRSGRRWCSTPSRSTAAAASMATTPGEVLADGWSLVIFPEGTRSKDGWVGRFQLGAAYLACQHGVPVVPGRAPRHLRRDAARPGLARPRPAAAHDPVRRAADARRGRESRATSRRRIKDAVGRPARRGQDDLVGGPPPPGRRHHPRPLRPADRPVAPGLGADRAGSDGSGGPAGPSLEAVTVATSRSTGAASS